MYDKTTVLQRKLYIQIYPEKITRMHGWHNLMKDSRHTHKKKEEKLRH